MQVIDHIHPQAHATQYSTKWNQRKKNTNNKQKHWFFFFHIILKRKSLLNPNTKKKKEKWQTKKCGPYERQVQDIVVRQTDKTLNGTMRLLPFLIVWISKMQKLISIYIYLLTITKKKKKKNWQACKKCDLIECFVSLFVSSFYSICSISFVCFITTLALKHWIL